jgi:hypothetical protein
MMKTLGHDAMSCDLEPCATGGGHYQGDVLEILDWGWDLMIAHPPCTFLCLSGARWFYHPDDDHLHPLDRRPHPDYPDRMENFQDGIDFFLALQTAPIDKICIENSTPLGKTIHHAGRPTQIVQPWWFGDPTVKGAALWLKNLRPLVATHEQPEILKAEVHEMQPGKERSKLRSRTPYAIANAMAEQWGTDFDHTTLNQGSLFE